MPKLFEPIRIRNLEIRNRVWLSPMCQYSCENQDGIVNDWHLVHYGSRAVGGFGLIIVEASGVVPEGRISPWDAGIWNDEHVIAWQKVNDVIHSHGAKSAIQLAHSGRKGSIHREWSGKGSIEPSQGGWQTVSSGSEAFDGYAPTRELATAEIAPIVRAFVEAAKRAVAANFDAVEIHAAHGYLLNQFLSPITNQRTDEYGGSLENRARFLLEVVRSVRAELGENFPILVRFSATDYREDGFTVEETTQVAKWCHEAGADMFDISSGGLVTGVQIPLGPGYQVPLAEYVGSHIGEPVSAVGAITDGIQAEQILESDKVSVIMIGRAGLRDPYWPLRAAHELGVSLDYWAKQYTRGQFPIQ